MTFDEFFRKATGFDHAPYPFQRKFAKAEDLYQLVDVPTGLGKTAMVIVGWLWRRFHAEEAIRKATPRRLVYCLPMRVLVEQTTENARKWVKNLLDAGGLQNDVPIHVLMGGEEQTDWAMWPEREAILIGTQDMLLSRALNRGYAASRARWPMEFGLLHNDCLWVFDEIQLMGPGLATTAQLEGFRYLLGSRDGHGCRSVWMSATMQRDWLKTVDFAPWVDNLAPLELTDDDHKCAEVKKRWEANKPLKPTNAKIGDLAGLAEEILKAHKPGTRTIVVVNTVRRASELHSEIARQWGSGNDQQLVLLHSRFRPGDRSKVVEDTLADPPADGTIVVSTQVIEAGVDVSATTLFTELAPWTSLVQRFGRCNRRGTENEHAAVRWLDLPANKPEGFGLPYESADLELARKRLNALNDVGLKSLPTVDLPFDHSHVIRRKDLIDLFDTTPDLAGNDIDIDRFIRDVQETDVRVFWRAWNQPHKNDPPSDDQSVPFRDELCPAPVSEFRDFKKKHAGKVWRWDFLEKRWEEADAARIVPGQVYLIHADAGGYTRECGWNPSSKEAVEPIVIPNKVPIPDASDNDACSCISVWQTIGQHTEEVCHELESILRGLPIDEEAEALRHAARWHDRGKVHEVFVKALPDAPPTQGNHWAKAPGTWKRYNRRHFRHELASALAALQKQHESLDLLNDDDLNLIVYLVAAHHGKVRLSIRSLPNEIRPAENRRFARGVWDGDVLPETDLGGGLTAPAVTLSLEPMELGLCEQPPFAGQPSWAERMIHLRDRLGPFRLAYLEVLLRVADWRASQREDHP